LIPSAESVKTDFLRRLELGDLLIFLYGLAIIRQFFWPLQQNSLAWVLTIAVALVCFYLYVSTKPLLAPRVSINFWLIVGLPLFAAYALRAAFPDRSFDVWSYHILNSERSLHGPLFGSGDYFPTWVPFNPVSDTVMGIGRLVLGYRLGTIINLLVLLWAAQIVERILRSFIDKAWLRYLAVAVILLSEHLLFEISTYMVDLLTIPLLLQATYITLHLEEAPRRAHSLLHVALLSGVSVAFKLTNLVAAIPLLAICALKMTFGDRRLSAKELITTSLQMLAVFIVPILPFTIYIYRLTGNPVFPVANSFFQSDYWPTHGGWDDRWGPETVWQKIAWPVLVWFKPERHSELGVYSGRISLAFVVALIFLAVVWRNTQARMLCILFLTTALLWAAGAIGYGRYGLFDEVLSGVTVCVIAALLIRGRQRAWKTGIAVALSVLLVIQTVIAVHYTLQKEWGARETIITAPHEYAAEAKFILRDHSLRHFLSDEEKTRFDRVQVWFESGPEATAFEVLLNDRAPILALRQPEFFSTRAAWREFIRKVEATGGQNMYSLCFNASLDNAKRAVSDRGLELGSVTPVTLPLFSSSNRIGMMLLEIRLPQTPSGREEFETAWLKSAFPPSDYREQITALNPPSVMRAGQKLDIHLKVKNLGLATWPATGTKDFKYLIDMGNHWIRGTENKEDNRAVLPADLPPGGETQLTMTITAPAQPGDYILEFDMVHEAVTWFKQRGASPLSLKVTVTP